MTQNCYIFQVYQMIKIEEHFVIVLRCLMHILHTAIRNQVFPLQPFPTLSIGWKTLIVLLATEQGYKQKSIVNDITFWVRHVQVTQRFIIPNENIYKLKTHTFNASDPRPFKINVITSTHALRTSTSGSDVRSDVTQFTIWKGEIRMFPF